MKRRAQVLGDEEWISTGVVGQKGDELARGRIEHTARHLGYFLVGHTRDEVLFDCFGAYERTKPIAALIGAIGANDDAAQPFGSSPREILQEPEREFVGPLQIFEDQHHGTLSPEGAEGLTERFVEAFFGKL